MSVLIYFINSVNFELNRVDLYDCAYLNIYSHPIGDILSTESSAYENMMHHNAITSAPPDPACGRRASMFTSCTQSKLVDAARTS